jgi:hypothetical protein
MRVDQNHARWEQPFSTDRGQFVGDQLEHGFYPAVIDGLRMS